MKNEELLKQFPEKTFYEKFQEKKNALVSIGTPSDQLNSKEGEFTKIFEYDKLVKLIYDKILSKEKLVLDDRKMSKIQSHFLQITELNNHLESDLNYQNNQDVDQLFAKFIDFLRSKGFLDNIKYNVGNMEVLTNESILDKYIGELETILKEFESLDLNLKNIKEVKSAIDNILKNKEKYEIAAKTAENWIKSDQKALTYSIKDKSIIFDNKANDEHSIKNYKPWLIASIVVGFIMLIYVGYFIHELKGAGNISIGTALLRISSLVVLSYFIFIFSQQFLNHRKLYEFYKFKAIALKTMEELLKTYTEQDDKELILNKSINIIFSEPNFSENKHLQQKLVDELLDIIKKKA